jgi:hypothetical protein
MAASVAAETKVAAHPATGWVNGCPEAEVAVVGEAGYARWRRRQAGAVARANGFLRGTEARRQDAIATGNADGP